MHFENIWNNAEKLGEEIQESEDIAEDINVIRRALDRLAGVVTLEEQNELTGEILFSLCQITRKRPMNSAAILNLTIENKRAQILDPPDD